MEDYFCLIMGGILGFLLTINFLLLPLQDNNEKECYQYYKENNGYILDSCEKYAEKWSDLNES